jgi:hypothetical protein
MRPTTVLKTMRLPGLDHCSATRAPGCSHPHHSMSPAFAALRPDGHRPELMAHHVRLLAVVHRLLSST